MVGLGEGSWRVRGLRLGYAWLLPWKLQPGILLCRAAAIPHLDRVSPPSEKRGQRERSDKNKKEGRKRARLARRVTTSQGSECGTGRDCERVSHSSAPPEIYFPTVPKVQFVCVCVCVSRIIKVIHEFLSSVSFDLFFFFESPLFLSADEPREWP